MQRIFYAFTPFCLIGASLHSSPADACGKLSFQDADAPRNLRPVPEPIVLKQSPNEKPTPSEINRSSFFGVRHLEGRGIGFDKGYTSLDAFLSFPRTEMIPFIDLRGHLFNNGKFDANAGLGFRRICGTRSWGGSAFYDYRYGHHHRYHQIGIGFETLGEEWDFMINGYLPVGAKKSSFFHERVEIIPSSAAFSRFSGHSLFILPPGAQCTAKSEKKREWALKGVDALASTRLFSTGNVHLRATLGPYYLQGYHREIAFGAKAKLSLEWKEILGLRVYGSYDTLFRGRLQGEITFSYPFGPRVKKPAPHTIERLFSPVERAEIIALHTHKIRTRETFVNSSGETLAIDPSTGDPYVFWFVDNTSHSNGTFESPFNTLVAATSASAPHEIIYVFPGDGTTTGLNAFATSFQLKDQQQLLGAGYSYGFATQFGEITVPAQASGMPSLTADSDVPVVVIANGNTVSGFQITASGVINVAPPTAWCVGSKNGAGFTGFTATNNRLIASGISAYPVQLTNPAGAILLSSNTILGDGANTPVGLELDATTAQTGTISLLNNRVENIIFQGILIGPDAGSYTCVLQGNSLSNIQTPLYFQTSLNATLDAQVENNSLSSCSQGIFALSIASSSLSANIHSNTISQATSTGARISSSDSSTLCLRFQDNSTNISNSFSQANTSLFNLEPYTGNSQPFTSSGTITNVPQGTCGN